MMVSIKETLDSWDLDYSSLSFPAAPSACALCTHAPVFSLEADPENFKGGCQQLMHPAVSIVFDYATVLRLFNLYSGPQVAELVFPSGFFKGRSLRSVTGEVFEEYLDARLVEYLKENRNQFLKDFLRKYRLEARGGEEVLMTLRPFFSPAPMRYAKAFFSVWGPLIKAPRWALGLNSTFAGAPVYSAPFEGDSEAVLETASVLLKTMPLGEALAAARSL